MHNKPLRMLRTLVLCGLLQEQRAAALELYPLWENGHQTSGAALWGGIFPATVKLDPVDVYSVAVNL